MVRMVTPVITSGDRAREGKGFSVEELKAVELTPGEATRLGIPTTPGGGRATRTTWRPSGST